VMEGAHHGPTYYLADRHGRRHLGRVLYGVSHRSVPRPQGGRRTRRPLSRLRTPPAPRPPAPPGLTTHPVTAREGAARACSSRLGPATHRLAPAPPPRLGSPGGPWPLPPPRGPIAGPLAVARP